MNIRSNDRDDQDYGSDGREGRYTAREYHHRLPIFEGDTIKMNDHIFQCRSNATTPKQVLLPLYEQEFYVSS